MPHQVEKLTASLISESRKGKIEMRQKALHTIKELVNNTNKDTLQLLSLPSTAWLFEGQALRYIKSNDKNINAVLHAFENNYKLYVKLCKEVFNIECTNKNVIQPDSHWRVKGSYRDIPVMLHNINVLNYLKNKKETFDFMWLDLMSPIDCISSYLACIEEKTNPNGVVILSFIKGREKLKISDRVEYVMNHLKDMDLIDRYDYNDTSPMVNIFLRKRLTREDLEETIYLGPEQTQTTNTLLMLNEENNSEKAPVAKTIAIVIEKLEGGYIANPNGKRRIFEAAEDILDTIGVNKILNGMENTEYHLDIRLTPKGEYLEADTLVAILDGHLEEELTLESARANGMIEKETFSPVKAPVEPDLKAPIKAVTAATAYPIARLKAINWQELHEQLHMEPSEISRETGLNVTSLYNCLPKVRAGKFDFKNTKTRIGFTVLAQLYERVLNIRTSTKDRHELMKENLLKHIRKIELIANGKQHVKVSDIAKELIEMRKELL